jgi:hypothetical protein
MTNKLKIKMNNKIMIICRIKFNKYIIKLITYRNIKKNKSERKMSNNNYKIIILIKNKINFSNRKHSL